VSPSHPQSPIPETTYGPYSPIRQAGDLYFVSGQVGLDPATKTASVSIERQTAQALTNLSNVLKKAGLSLANVVKTTVYLTDMSDFYAMNDEYLRHFESPRPARSTVAVAELPSLGDDVPLYVEIEAIAAANTAINTNHKDLPDA
jgi:2-iminobutanoate/2-iminopropanoate deaminase